MFRMQHFIHTDENNDLKRKTSFHRIVGSCVYTKIFLLISGSKVSRNINQNVLSASTNYHRSCVYDGLLVGDKHLYEFF